MTTNRELINELISTGYLKSPNIIKAFEKVDRFDFVPAEFQNEAYGNYPLSLGLGQTISQPATVAFMLELLDAHTGDKVLDVGSGSGWQTALLSEIVGAKGKVIGLEIKDELVKLGQANIKKYHFKNTAILKGSGWAGLPEQAPFDRIIVAAAAKTIPQALKEQLKINGRLVIPVGQGLQDIVAINRLDEKNYQAEHYPGFVFVPLVDN